MGTDMGVRSLLVIVVLGLGATVGQGEVLIDWVTVGNPGNPRDPHPEGGRGNVDDVYRSFRRSGVFTRLRREARREAEARAGKPPVAPGGNECRSPPEDLATHCKFWRIAMVLLELSLDSKDSLS